MSHVARCVLAQAIATDAALWITLIGMEAHAESEHAQPADREYSKV